MNSMNRVYFLQFKSKTFSSNDSVDERALMTSVLIEHRGLEAAYSVAVGRQQQLLLVDVVQQPRSLHER